LVRTALRRVTWAALATAPLACGDGGVSDPRPLAAFWPSYLERYVDAQGYVLDPRRDGAVASTKGTLND